MVKNLSIFIIILILFANFFNVQAIDIKSRESLYLDDSLSKEEQDFNLPSQILLVPVFFPEPNTSIDGKKWIQGLHYYSVARLGYPDIPFHYIVLSNGEVYKTNKYGDEAKINIVGSGENPIIVGYLAKNNSRDFSDEARASISDLLITLANTHSIKSDSIELVNMMFNLNLKTHLATIETRNVTGGWSASYRQLQKNVDRNYKPINKKYSLEIISVKAPEQEVKPGQTAIIELTLKNVGQYSIFADSDSEIFATKFDGKLSKFFLNGIWASQSQVAIMTEGERLRPNEEKVFQIKFNVPLYFGKQTEKFYIRNMLGQKIENTDFLVSLNVGKITSTVVEILNTETGYLNVRKTDSGNSPVVTRVSPGERYILKRTGTYGYVELDLGEGRTGWVSQKYVKVVN